MYLYAPDQSVRIVISAELSRTLNLSGLAGELSPLKFVAFSWRTFGIISRENRKIMRDRAVKMRLALTPQEFKLMRLFRENRLRLAKFQTQRWIGGFIIDFVFRCPTLGVEVDGEFHEKNSEYDTWRDSFLWAKYHIPILRFSNREVDETPGLVVSRIASAISNIRQEIRNAIRLSENSPVHKNSGRDYIRYPRVVGGARGVDGDSQGRVCRVDAVGDV